MTSKHKCSKKISVDGWHRQPCTRPATVQRDGQWWCWQHDPERVAVRRAAWKAKRDREDAEYARRARDARLGKLVTLELAALLERLAKEANLSYEKAGDHGDSKAGWAVQLHLDNKAAHALAARIREALEKR